MACRYPVTSSHLTRWTFRGPASCSCRAASPVLHAWAARHNGSACGVKRMTCVLQKIVPRWRLRRSLRDSYLRNPKAKCCITNRKSAEVSQLTACVKGAFSEARPSARLITYSGLPFITCRTGAQSRQHLSIPTWLKNDSEVYHAGLIERRCQKRT